MSAPGKESSRAHVLVVEDSSVFREMQGLLLAQAGYACSLHENPQAALEIAAKHHFDLVVIDYELPMMNGEQFMHALRQIQPDIAVIFVSGTLTLELAVKLSSQSVAGIFNKPVNPKILLEKITETLARHAARDTAARLGSGSPLPVVPAPSSPFTTTATEPIANQLAYTPRFVLGSSDRFREFTHRLWKVRDFRAVMLLQGEAGSPFELIARELAEISIFRDGPIMVCDAAKFDAKGLIEVLAPSLLSHDAGTLIVSGVETFTPGQQKTLENLMSGRDVFLPFARKFRLVLAATPALSERVDEGTFNETVFYKVSSLTVTVPTLREMRGDVAANAKWILAAHREGGHPAAPAEIAADAAEWLEAQEWPGNYAELTRVVLNAVGQTDGAELTLAALEAAAASGDDTAIVAPAPVAFVDGDAPLTGEARPPFPIVSDLAVAGTVANAPASAPKPAPAAAPANGLVPATASLKPAAPVRPLSAQSLFRPASKTYSFSKRLEESLATADACAAH